MVDSLFRCGIVIFLIVFGYFLKKIGKLKKEDSRVFSTLILYVTLPCILINALRDFEFDVSLLFMVGLGLVSGFILMFVGYFLSGKEEKPIRAMYMLTESGYNVGSFCFPFISALFPEYLIYVVMFDIGNSVVCCGSAYAMALSVLHGEKFNVKSILYRLGTTVPFMVYLVMIVLNILHIHLPERLYQVTTTIGGANTVVAMMLLGILFEVNLTEKAKKDIFKILGSRLFCELCFVLFVVFLMPMPVMVKRVACMVLCAPISSMTAVFCSTFDCDSDVYGTAISLSIPISIVVLMIIAII